MSAIKILQKKRFTKVSFSGLTKFVLLVGLLPFGCKKNDNDLSNRKPYGHFFYCKVDGKDWYSSTNGALFSTDITGSTYGDTLLSIAAYRDIESFGISVNSNDLTKNSTYTLSDRPYTPQAIFSNDFGPGWYKTDSARTGQISLHFNKKMSVVEGSFAFKAYHPYSGKIIDIADGTFSITYQDK